MYRFQYEPGNGKCYENREFSDFCCMQIFHDVQTVFSYCDGDEFFTHFHRTAYMKPEWETAYEQAPKTGLKQNISQLKERESLTMFSF